MPTTALRASGHANSADVTGNKTLTLADSGIVQDVKASATITLPAVSSLAEFIIRVGKEGITVNISPNSSDLIAGAGAANSSAGADNKDVILTNQPSGSYVVISYADATGWKISEALGTFTFES